LMVGSYQLALELAKRDECRQLECPRILDDVDVFVKSLALFCRTADIFTMFAELVRQQPQATIQSEVWQRCTAKATRNFTQEMVEAYHAHNRRLAQLSCIPTDVQTGEQDDSEDDDDGGNDSDFSC
jgi:hypothetical protein